MQYHRPDGLNGRVRNGNGCGPTGKATSEGPPSRLGDGGLNFKVKEGNFLLLPTSAFLSKGPFIAPSSYALRITYCAFRRVSIKVAKPSTVSTGNLKTFRSLQLRPINRVVYPGSLGSKLPWNPRLGIGFTLRCFQRLSVPDIATQPCPKRDNWYTRGPSFPILSY